MTASYENDAKINKILKKVSFGPYSRRFWREFYAAALFWCTQPSSIFVY